MPKPNKPCYICGENSWWQRPDGSWNCGRCHQNPNPGSGPEPTVVEEEHDPEVLVLRDRVIKGNKKLNDAWGEICRINSESQEWKDLFEQWHQANERLSLLCTELKARGYEDCLYLDEQGKRTKSCLGQGGLGCRVCSSRTPYWEKELMALPSAGKSRSN